MMKGSPGYAIAFDGEIRERLYSLNNKKRYFYGYSIAAFRQLLPFSNAGMAI